MAQTIQPPSFVSDLKTYAEYKEDLKRWSRLTSLDKKLQAEMVIYHLDNHPSRIKEKIVSEVAADKLQSADCITHLITFLDEVYGKDEMTDMWEKYKLFSHHFRKPNEAINDFLPNWEMAYRKLKATGCEYPDSVLGLKLLEDAQLSELETKLVLTGVNFAEAKTNKDLQNQITKSLKKFTGRSVISSGKTSDNLAVSSIKTEPTFVAQMEEVLLAKGWKPPKKNRRRSRSESPPRRKPVYKGKKNPLGDNGRPLKCYLCKCDHDKCNCPCNYHLANNCPEKKNRVSNEQGKPSQPGSSGEKKLDLGLFVDSNISTYLVRDEDDVFVVNETLQNLVLLSANYQVALVDCACPTTVSGEKWLNEFFNQFGANLKSFIKTSESERIFKFGGGEKRKSKGIVIFPCSIGGKNIQLKTEVVDAEFPLLLGNSFLKKAGAILHLREERAQILGSTIDMRETNSGHFTVNISPPIEGAEFAQVKDNLEVDGRILECLVALDGGLTYKDIVKLHQTFGHVSVAKLEKLISNSKKLTDEVKGFLEKVEENCDSCKQHRVAKPRPAVSLPRAHKFNQIVSVDLKQYKDNKNNYILYMVDLFTRLTVGTFIERKLPSIVGEKILEKWIANFGRMDTIHSDRGGEFIASELVDIAEYIGVRSSFTAASSPHQNGINERNHAVVDRMIDKMRTQDPSLSAPVALVWALVAKNTLENVSGYSPFQLVFGKCPALPSVYTAGPPGYEEVVMEKAVADHINAMFLAREAYIQGESDKILKKALKQRVYKRGEDIRVGDWIYFTDKGKWKGPVKVTTKDGKSLYVVRAGRLLTINSDHAQLASFEGKLVEQKTDHDTKQNIETNNTIVNEDKLNIATNSNISTADVTNVDDSSSDNVESNNDGDSAVAVDGNEKLPRNLKKGDIVRYKAVDSPNVIESKVLRRAGKKGGKYDNWWNLSNVVTGHIEAVDMGKVEITDIVGTEKSLEKPEENVYVVGIPRYRHSEQACIDAKDKEFKSWDEYSVYKEVEDNGQIKLGTNWVLTEKCVNGVRTIKARLTIRGDQEETDGIRKDSPTVRKSNIKIFTVIAAMEGWDIKASDVASAFLQGVEIDRDVFILPPKERRVPNVLWKLLKPVYGLVDASRGWYLALDEEFLEAGCERCSLDPAMYLHFKTDESEDNKTIEGMALTHVDDVLHGGGDDFEEDIMTTVKSAFKFGLEEAERFRYVGMNMTQTSDGSILIDQDHYVKGLELPDMDAFEKLSSDEVLPAEGQTLFRGTVAKVLHVGYQSRPDVCFEAKCLSTKFGKATKSDLKLALKKMQKLQGAHTKMLFPKLGPLTELTLVGYGDAGIRSMPDKLSSVGGQVILLADTSRGLACVLNWRSKKLVRKVVSSLAGEALAMVATIGEMVYNRAILKQVYGEVINNIPVVIFTDSKNLSEAVHSTSLVEDAWLIPDIAVIKDALSNKTISCVRRVSGENMLANCLTKAGASAEQLMEVLRTGRYVLPEGVDV